MGYAHSSEVSEAALARAAEAVRAVKGGYCGAYAEPPGRTNVRLYGDDNPLGAPAFETKVKLLETIDAYARARDPRVRQVSISFGASWQVIEILRGDGESYRDVRPLVRVNTSVVVGKGDRHALGPEQSLILLGQAGAGRREDPHEILLRQRLQFDADRQPPL